MLSLGQRTYRERLARLVSKTTLRDVVGMTWSAWAIQNGQEHVARRYMEFSPEATDGAAGAPYVLYPWQLETLVNYATRIWRNHELPEGVTADVRDKVLAWISCTSDEAVLEAKRLRSGSGHIGYEPSVLRRKPILLFGANGVDAMAPLPPLIMQRITSGLYFDIVDGGGTIWGEVGRRFEGYCLRYLKAMLPDQHVDPEYRYGPKGHGFDSPDILVSDEGRIRLVVECKAKRMPVEARFSGDPVSEAAMAYTEIAKGVFQVWRFLSHARRGLLDRTVANDCLGMVVTADPWLVMGQKLYPEVMAIANTIADEKDPQISAEDRRRVPIVLIDDLEYTLQHADTVIFFERLRALSEDQTGWDWSLTPGQSDGPVRP